MTFVNSRASHNSIEEPPTNTLHVRADSRHITGDRDGGDRTTKSTPKTETIHLYFTFSSVHYITTLDTGRAVSVLGPT